MAEPFAAGIVLAAGGSRRLGEPKQLLAYGRATLLDAVLDTARASGLDQVVVAVGGAAQQVRAGVDLSGTTVVENPVYGLGCSSTIAAAMARVDPRADVVVLLLGDQPGVTAATVRTLLARRGSAPIAVCRYDDGRGHPLAFGRARFAELTQLHGDKAVWKLLDAWAGEVTEVSISGPVPPDVDTWDDYERVLAGVPGAR